MYSSDINEIQEWRQRTTNAVVQRKIVSISTSDNLNTRKLKCYQCALQTAIYGICQFCQRQKQQEQRTFFREDIFREIWNFTDKTFLSSPRSNFGYVALHPCGLLLIGHMPTVRRWTDAVSSVVVWPRSLQTTTI